MNFLILYEYILRARMALGLPSPAAASRCLISDDSCEIPATPLFLLIMLFTPLTLSPSFSARYKSTPGSISPVREHIISPSTGVNPIQVSIDLPFSMAVMEAPLPRWHVMIFVLWKSMLRSLQAFSATNLWLVPWNPY